MNENIKKFEYYIFIKKIKEKNIIKNQIKTNIILFQKRSALDQLLINIISEMKNNILEEKLKILLIKKFIYKAKNNHLKNYKEEKKFKENQKNKFNDNKQISELILSKKNAFNDFLKKSYVNSFLTKTRISINNKKLLNIQENYKKEKRKEYLINFFERIKSINSIHFSKEKKIFYQKVFFKSVKNNLLNKSRDVNIKNKLTNIKRTFLYKVNWHLFMKKYKENSDKINKINLLKQKIQIFQEKEKISQKKYFKIFINKVKIMKQTNDSLKRKIFNILKNNAIINKELKHFLIEAEAIE
jgi:hypothetical protein